MLLMDFLFLSLLTSIGDHGYDLWHDSGFGRSEGWAAPVSALLEEDHISRTECNRAKSVSRFFESSCVPGASDYRLNPNVTAAEMLCRNCIGDDQGEHSCERGPHSERYDGEAGAFRCLVEGRGDVAFVNHFTPFVFTNGRSNEHWAQNLRSDDFRLLCKTGGQGFISEYERCNMARIPNHFIAASDAMSHEERLDTQHFMASLADNFIRKAPESFKIFGPYQNTSDLVFSDIATGIQALESDVTYKTALGDYLPIAQNMDQYYCENSASTIILSSSLASLILLLLLRNLFNQLN